MRNEKKYYASVSGGKDSVAMVFKLMEKEYPLDGVLFVDLGAEFDALYDAIGCVKEECARRNIPFYELKPEHDFYYYCLEKEVHKRNGVLQNGMKWCGGTCRWGTAIKFQMLENFYREKCSSCEVVEYVGVAADEEVRISKNKHCKHTKCYPLIEWEMKESDCLLYCYDKGIYWLQDGKRLYDYLDRVSCRICRNKNLKELKNYYIHFPSIWNELLELQEEIPDMPFYKGELTIGQLQERFEKEIYLDSLQLRLL